MLFSTRVQIKPSPTADTRTCDFSKVTENELLTSSVKHIEDVNKGLQLFAEKLKIMSTGIRHDHDKISGITQFHTDFIGGFKNTGWWDNHRKVNRHHLNTPDGVPEDVNLLDVLEYITDCVMAGLARSGSVRKIDIDSKVLQTAFDNTVQSLVDAVDLLEE